MAYNEGIIQITGKYMKSLKQLVLLSIFLCNIMHNAHLFGKSGLFPFGE